MSELISKANAKAEAGKVKPRGPTPLGDGRGRPPGSTLLKGEVEAQGSTNQTEAAQGSESESNTLGQPARRNANAIACARGVNINMKENPAQEPTGMIQSITKGQGQASHSTGEKSNRRLQATEISDINKTRTASVTIEDSKGLAEPAAVAYPAKLETVSNGQNNNAITGQETSAVTADKKGSKLPLNANLRVKVTIKSKQHILLITKGNKIHQNKGEWPPIGYPQTQAAKKEKISA